MTRKRPGLDDAYGLTTPDDSRALYADWAETYDTDFAQSMGYALPRAVARVFSDAGGAGPVLDVGAGTGLLGAELAALGIGPLDAVDISAEMLAAAHAKGIYRRCVEADLTQALPMADGTYRGVVSAGTFTTGHVGPDAIAELVRVAAPGARVALSVNASHWQSAGFAEFFGGIADQTGDLHRHDVAIYDAAASGPHADDRSEIVSFVLRGQ